MVEATVVVFLIAATFFFTRWFFSGNRTYPERVVQGVSKVETTSGEDFYDLDNRLRKLEMRFGGLVDEVTERADYAKGTWRKVSAAQKRFEELEENGEPEEIRRGDGEGSPVQEVPPVYPVLVSGKQARRAERAALRANRRVRHG